MTQLLPGNSLGFLLTDVARLFRQAFEQSVEDAGLELTAGEIRALAHVGRYLGSRQAVLAERMGIEPMTLSAYLDRLEARGLVRRTVDPSDRRAKVIDTTPAADAVFDRVRPLAHGLYDRMTQHLPREHVEVLQHALTVIRSNLASDPRLGDAPAP